MTVYTNNATYYCNIRLLILYCRFVKICETAYLALRKKANFLITLFMMMMNTGIPEISTIKDIKYLQVNGIDSESYYYLLGSGESYGPTAQHWQDYPIFFIQLNYVHKSKQIRHCHLMLNSSATRWHLGFCVLFLNSAILHSCTFGNSFYICWNSLYYLPSINCFCWIDIVCIYRYAFRHIVGFYSLFLYLGDEYVSWSACSHKWHVFVILFFLYPAQNVMGISSVGSFPVWCGGSLIIFPALKM